MQKLPEDELREFLGFARDRASIDNQLALRLKTQLAESFRQQLVIGAPTNNDEATLRHLARQLRAKKVIVKLHLRHLLHAKLYLLYRSDPVTPSSATWAAAISLSPDWLARVS
jgi:hypothetical protein